MMMMMMMIRGDLEEAWIFWTVGCVDGHSGPRGSIFWSVKTELCFHCKFQFLGYNSGGSGRVWVFGLCDM